jgi:hypothetical protein
MAMMNRFAILTETTEEPKKFGKNHGKHKGRAAKRVAMRAVEQAAAEQRQAEYRLRRNHFNPGFGFRRHEMNFENDENCDNRDNRFVWFADSNRGTEDVHLTLDMFPPLK